MSSNLLDWKSSAFNRSPTLSGIEECKALLPCPEHLNSIAGHDRRWNSALLSLVTHGFHSDDGHLDQTNSFHALTSQHYLTGYSKTQPATEQDRLKNWRARATHAEQILHTIFDLANRLTGGSTIVLHHPGATSPGLDVSPENLKAEVYVNPKPEPLQKIGFRIIGTGSSSQMPSKGKTTSKGKGRADVMPLVPSPVSPSSTHFTFHGRPRGSLEGLLSSGSILSYMPVYDGRITWKPTQIRLMHTRESVSTSHLVPKEEPSRRTAAQAASPMESVSMSHLVRKEEPSRRTAVSATSPITLSTSPRAAQRRYPPATPMKGKSVSFERSPPTPMLITARSPQYHVPTLLPFGTETEAVLEELGYPDHFHRPVTSFTVRITVMVLPVTARSHNPRRLVPRARAPYIKVSKEVRQQLTEWRQAKRLDEDKEIRAVLNYIHAKATELASKFKQPRRRYLERLSLGSVIHCRKRNKTSAWHAYMHFKGIENNANKGFSEKSNIADLVKEKTEYHRLTTEEKEQLIIDFDKVKKSSQDRPPNITAKSRAAECSRSFQFVREELEALKERVGAEAFIVMVRGVSDFTMVPKAFFTSPTAEHFTQLLIIDSKVTNNPAAVMEFKCYNDLVQRYHVKLVGWNHPYWANPSDLKGGIESLENVVLAIQANTCKFVTITPQEAKERMCRIKDGETLTPDLEPSLTPDPKPSLTPDPEPSLTPDLESSLTPDLEPSLTPDLEPSMPPNLPTPNSTQPANIRVASSEPYVRPSSFTDEMVDPALRALDHATSDNEPPIVQLPPTPPMPTPLPIAGEAHVLVAATNRGKRAADVSTGTSRSKCARKLMEKGQSELESRTRARCGPTKKGTRLSKKSNVHVESDHENTE
ncbi:hypothetical protein EV702DRAFT_1255566 [Suillus placidus]|uniref:Uncharacterized protein n=1 Tax=Suillus placidus TaxID=48579 RepID=A0A9P7A0L5_9AGAM|nr:hypothetical protein EV702DRAFT_1255566 [Suillus placidus]